MQADQICRLHDRTWCGLHRALTFKSAVDDPSRFERSQTIAAHFGLTPRRYHQANRQPGHISKTGDSEVRSALYAAACIVVTRSTKPPALKRALVAVARKLAVILSHDVDRWH